MAATGITTGLAATEFGPDHDATRAMIATFLWRLEGSPSQGDSTNDFIDVTREWQLDPVEWLWRNGPTRGRAPTMFAPDQPVIRGELLTFVWRWHGEPAPPADLVAPDPIDCLVATRTCADVFSLDVAAEIGALAAGRRITAHVHDHRTGCTHELNPGLSVTTASVIKAQVLAGHGGGRGGRHGNNRRALGCDSMGLDERRLGRPVVGDLLRPAGRSRLRSEERVLPDAGPGMAARLGWCDSR
jgi:hypothetical protein